MSADHLEKTPYSIVLKCRFILVFGMIGSVTTTSQFLYLIITDPVPNTSFFYALCFAAPLLYITTYFAYKKRPLAASYLALIVSILGCFAALNLIFAAFLTMIMIFVFSAIFISIRQDQMVIFYLSMILSAVIKILVELKVFSISFIPHSSLDNESILFICMFLFSVFTYAFIVNYLINRGLQSSEKLMDTSAQLEETLKVKDQLITLISHDLKNPIGNISMIANEIQRKTLPITPEVLDMLKDTSTKASNLIENLTRWSVVKQDETMVRKEIFNLYECIQENIDLLNIMSSQKQIEIINNCNKEADVKADRSMISTVIRNLVSNAIKYSHDKSKIEIDSTIKSAYIHTSIHDFGVGLTPEHQRKLFLDNKDYNSIPGTSNEKGSGLGLIISKDFVDLNGGNIGVESKIGKGSTFWFSIPIAENNK